MTRHTLMAALLCGTTAAMGTEAAAQERAWEDRAHVSVNVGQQVTATTFQDSLDFTANLESGTFRARYGVSKGPAFDGGVAVRLWKNFGAGVAVSVFRRKDSGSFELRVPHPLYFNTSRVVSGDVADLERTETAAHIQAVYMIPASNRLRILVSAGPTFFMVKQDFANGVSYDEVYPFDSLANPQPRTTNDSRTRVGYNAGADITYLIGGRWGVGGLVRFSRATLTIPVRGQDALVGDRDVSVKAGGFQAGAGVRFGF